MRFAQLPALALAFAVTADPTTAGTIAKPTCARELARTETSLLKTLARIQTVANHSQPEQCETYRAHAAAVAKARDVFERCGTGAARERDIGEMDGAFDRAKAGIASTCPTP